MKEKPPETLPELLAPAGNALCAVAAVNAGADAVYAGLDRFNARARGENFSRDDMARLAEYLHRRGKKLYLTVNTVIKENELESAAGLLSFAREIGADAIIVQDIGLARLARRYFPELRLHASTQMAIHNLEGVSVAEKLGFSRVILERQLDIGELEAMAPDSPLELEVFIHGALCCSLSGSCYFSSWLGGASGNRGQCKQPCRRRYFSNSGNGFFFSAADLCTAGNMLERIVRIPNVVSLKIEGRLRRSDYVRDTVAAYRGLLDRALNGGEARKLLSGVGGRKWSSGFLTSESRRELVQYRSLGAAGQLLGRVISAGAGRFEFVSGHPFAAGDRLRVQSDDGGDAPGFDAAGMRVDGLPVKRVKPGVRCEISWPVPVTPGSLVFRLGGRQESGVGDFAETPLPGPRLDLEAEFSESGLRVRLPGLAAAGEFRSVWALEPSRAGAPDAALEAVRRRFAAGESGVFRAGRVEVSASAPGLYIPPSMLRKAFREFVLFVADALRHHPLPADPALEAVLAMLAARHGRRAALPVPAGPETVAVKPRGCEPGNPGARRAVNILDFSAETRECILPDFCEPGRMPGLKKRIAMARAAGITGFRITNLSGFALFRDFPEARLVTGNPLPAANSMTAEVLAELGAVQVQASWELERGAVEALRDASPLPVEVYRFGRPALLTTRAELPVADGERFKDARGIEFTVRRDRRSGLIRVYALRVMSLPAVPGTADYYDLTNASWREKNTSSFNFDAELI